MRFIEHNSSILWTTDRTFFCSLDHTWGLLNCSSLYRVQETVVVYFNFGYSAGENARVNNNNFHLSPRLNSEAH